MAAKKLFLTGSKGTDSVVNALPDPAVWESLRRSRDEDSASGEVKAAGIERASSRNSFQITGGTDANERNRQKTAARVDDSGEAFR